MSLTANNLEVFTASKKELKDVNISLQNVNDNDQKKCKEIKDSINLDKSISKTSSTIEKSIANSPIKETKLKEINFITHNNFDEHFLNYFSNGFEIAKNTGSLKVGILHQAILPTFGHFSRQNNFKFELVWDQNRLKNDEFSYIKKEIQSIIGIFDIPETDLCDLISKNDYDFLKIKNYCINNKSELQKKISGSLFGKNLRKTRNSSIGRK